MRAGGRGSRQASRTAPRRPDRSGRAAGGARGAALRRHFDRLARAELRKRVDRTCREPVETSHSVKTHTPCLYTCRTCSLHARCVRTLADEHRIEDTHVEVLMDRRKPRRRSPVGADRDGRIRGHPAARFEHRCAHNRSSGVYPPILALLHACEQCARDRVGLICKS